MAHRSRSARRRARTNRMAMNSAASNQPQVNRAEMNGVEVNRTGADRASINRANAAHSTGPRTPEGKAASRGNALKHGLFARAVKLPSERLGEDRGAFEVLHAELFDHHEPQGPEEVLMVERIATIWWQLARLNAQSQFKLKSALEAGSDPIEALAESDAANSAEARLERSLMRLHRNLAFLQKWRVDRRQRREVAAFEEEWTAEEAQMEGIIQEGLRRARERERTRAESSETTIEELEAQITAARAGKDGDEIVEKSAA